MAIAHVRHGKGAQHVIGLHGWFGSAQGWGHDFVGALNEEAFTYLFMDYRGYGGRKAELGSFTMEEIATDALTLADEFGWETFSLLGHSMGGMAAQKVASLAPQRVEAIVGISPVPATGVPFDEQSWGLFSGAAENDDNRFAIIDFTTGNRLSPLWVRSMVAHSVEHSTREAFGAYLLAWGKSDFQADVVGLPHRALAIVGENDPAISAAVMEMTWMQAFENGALDIFTNAGHYASFETPIATATAVENFLAG